MLHRQRLDELLAEMKALLAKELAAHSPMSWLQRLKADAPEYEEWAVWAAEDILKTVKWDPGGGCILCRS